MTNPIGKATLDQSAGVCLLRVIADFMPGLIQSKSKMANAPRTRFSKVDMIATGSNVESL